MIIVKLKGGLGNQLFQYATALRLASQHQTTVRMNCFDFGIKKYLARDRKRSFELDHFTISGQVALAPELFFYRLMSGMYQPITETAFTFDERVLVAKNNSYLNGFWQSYKYFDDIRPLVLRELSFKEAPSPKNADLLKKIQKTNAISLHVRRGDYVSDPLTVQHHGITPLDYYHTAIAQMVVKVKQPHFYLFSDDPVWVKENLKLAYPVTYVDHNNGNMAYEDLRLMSHCQHFIIANSTFSWWGAWLSQNTNKIVIAPKKWFNDPTKDSRDLIPPSWLRL
jgi:hypothetical protein